MRVRPALARRLARWGHRLPRTVRRFLLDRLAGGFLAEGISKGMHEHHRLENGLTIVANPLLHGSLFANGEFGYERNVVTVLEELVSEGDVVYDLGANIGLFSLLASTCVGRSGRVYAFEPETNNIECFRKALEINRVENITLLALAIAERDGVMAFDRRGGAFSGRLVTGSEPGRGRRSTVEVRTLDSLVSRQHCRPPSFCKIDVEGGEGAVLLGAREILRKYRPMLLVEMHRDNPDGVRTAYQVLDEFGYDLFRVDHVGDGGPREPLTDRTTGARHVLALPANGMPVGRPD